MTTTSRAARAGLLAFLFAQLAGCGGGGGSSPTPPPPPPPPPATVLSFSPADAATQVDVQSTLAIAFDKGLDPTSVTRAHVTLVSQGVPVATKVSYDDATHRVLVDPMGLSNGHSYTLAISGLVDANGKSVASRQAAFSTWINGETSGVYLLFTSWNTTTVYRAQVDTFDASGAPSGSYFSNDPGADGTWGTADDVIFGGYITDSYRSDGQLASETSYGAGSDGLWHTADDTPTTFKTRTFLPNGALATDDSLNVTAPYGSASVHAEVFTTYAYNADGTLKNAISATGKGADGVWGTADDVIGWAVTYTYDDLGRLVNEQYADFVGADGVWGTADDQEYEHVQHFYLASGRPDRVEYYDHGIGPYSATDNVLEGVDTYSYDAANNLVQILYGGPPGVSGGAYTLLTYDAHNNRQTRKYYDYAGADGLWGTADDRLAVWRTFDTTK